MSRITRLANLPDVLVIRRLVAGRVGSTRDDDRLRAEIAIRWPAIRDGAYPWWTALYVARPALALALPQTLRRAVRMTLRRAGQRAPRDDAR
jgi:hypothetical protein